MKIIFIFCTIFLTINPVFANSKFEIERKGDFQSLIFLKESHQSSFPVKFTLNSKILNLKIIKKIPNYVIFFNAKDKRWNVAYLWDTKDNEFYFLSTDQKSNRFYLGGNATGKFLKYAQKKFQNAGEWEGTYSFAESEPHLNPEHPPMSWEYILKIKKYKNKYVASFEENGFQTFTKFNSVSISVGFNRIDVLVNEVVDNFKDSYSKGDRLFSLIYQETDFDGKKLFTKWDSITPQISKCNICFYKE